VDPKSKAASPSVVVSSVTMAVSSAASSLLLLSELLLSELLDSLLWLLDSELWLELLLPDPELLLSDSELLAELLWSGFSAAGRALDKAAKATRTTRMYSFIFSVVGSTLLFKVETGIFIPVVDVI
jgi:hypothetical protein